MTPGIRKNNLPRKTFLEGSEAKYPQTAYQSRTEFNDNEYDDMDNDDAYYKNH